MAQELVTEIMNFVKANGFDCKYIQEPVAKTLIEKLADRFSFNLNYRWLWDNGHSAISQRYDNNYSEWEAQLSLLLQNFETRIYFAVTGDEFHSWPIFDCPQDLLIEILKEQTPFEYIVFDESMKYVLFDTHHNELILTTAEHYPKKGTASQTP
jgi:hypothetical protein